jgi:hypothetical protein
MLIFTVQYVALITLRILRQAPVLKDCSFDFLKHTQKLARVWMCIAMFLCVCEANYVDDPKIVSVGAIPQRSCLKPIKTKIVVGHT